MRTLLKFKKRVPRYKRANVLETVKKQFNATSATDGIVVRHKRSDHRVLWLFLHGHTFFTDIKSLAPIVAASRPPSVRQLLISPDATRP